MTLEQEIDAIYKLDSERTQGEWSYNYLGGLIKLGGDNTIDAAMTDDDAYFIASAPQMVSIIKTLQAKNKKLKDDLANLDFLSKAEAAWHREDYEKTKVEQEKLLVIVQKCSMQDYENFEEVRNEAIACLEVHCDICGDYHDWNYIPLNCKTGNGE